MMRYQATTRRERRQVLISFPDCPGCHTVADPGQDVVAVAREALTGWIEAHLSRDRVPAVPRRRRSLPGGIDVAVPVRLAAKIILKRARLDLGLTQAQLALRAGVSQARIAQLESPGRDLRLDTLAHVAAALGLELDLAARPAA